MSDDKWIMFKNYMHNELGITQQDIRQWIKESVEETAKRMVSNEFDNFDHKRVVNDLIMSDEFFGSRELKDKIMRAVANKLTNKIEMTLKK